MRIRIAHSSREFECAPDEPLLDAALAAGLHLPYSCRGGNCGACRAQRLDGEVHYPNGVPLGLSAAERAQGYELLCQARPRSDLRLALELVRRADELETHRLPCRIERLEPLAHDVVGLWLKRPATEAFRFRPGQYLDILLPQARRRSYSLASPPHDARLLELHVRRVPGGVFSEPLFNSLKAGALLEIEGPLGQFYVREAHPERPLLLIGGGTGIAPLISIARHLIEQGSERELHLYWGVRASLDLYALPTLEALRRRASRFRYHTVLSADAGSTHRAGWVHAAALEDLGEALRARDFEVYAAGPPAMVAALRAALPAYGVGAERLYVDSFDYADDGARASSTAASRS